MSWHWPHFKSIIFMVKVLCTYSLHNKCVGWSGKWQDDDLNEIAFVINCFID